MSDFPTDIIQLIKHYALPIALVLLAFVTIIYLSRRKIKHNWLNLKTRYCLNRLGFKQICDLQCPDGLGHYFTIDRLILRHDGISLLLYKRYPGKIFCADKIDEWTQMLGQKSYRFKNPLYDLEHQIKAVSACAPDVPINGFLFFDHLTEFPKGHPDRIIHLKKIPQELKRHKHDEVESSVLSAWKNLQLMAKG
jgi:nuclease-like protein